MTVKRDLRQLQAMTADDADALYRRYALLCAKVKKSAAEAERKKIEIDTRHAAETADERAEIAALEETLLDYITANPTRFAKPRMRVVKGIGKYGMRTDGAKTIVEDAEAVIAFADAMGQDDTLYSIKKVIDKEAVERLIASGASVPGARIQAAGDVAKVMPPEKSYLEQVIG